MLQKFALAFKSKTIEFFAEEDDEEDEDGNTNPISDPTPEEIITGQRVVVLKPDHPSNSKQSISEWEAKNLTLTTAFAAMTSFSAAHLQLQSAHHPFPFDPNAAAAADSTAVSLLRLLSVLKSSDVTDFTSILESQVAENQSLLRALDSLSNQLQLRIETKDNMAAALRSELDHVNAVNSRLTDRLMAPPPPNPDADVVTSMLTVSVFDSVLRDAIRVTQRFARTLIGVMVSKAWDLSAVAEAAHPNVNYGKKGDCRYAILSGICLSMFDGFDSWDFDSALDEASESLLLPRDEALRQFIEHSGADPLELVNSSPDCDFAKFCDRKYKRVIRPGVESSLLDGELAGLVYELFMAMASSVWTLQRLAWAYDPVVGIFQIGRGTEFSAVYMENVVSRKGGGGGGGFGRLECVKVSRPRVGFTVLPGFRVGGTVIQCKVYLDDCGEKEL